MSKGSTRYDKSVIPIIIGVFSMRFWETLFISLPKLLNFSLALSSCSGILNIPFAGKNEIVCMIFPPVRSVQIQRFRHQVW